MTLRLILGTAFLLALLLAVAGCTQVIPLPPVLPATSSPTPVPTTLPADSVTPEPTGTLPSYWSVNVQAQSNGQAINPQIIITFRGGQGRVSSPGSCSRSPGRTALLRPGRWTSRSP